MGDINPINKPLVRDLQQMGILSVEATPKLIASLRCYTEAFLGGTNATTKVLAQIPISILSAMAYSVDGTAWNVANCLALNLTTNYTLVNATKTITYVGNSASGRLVVMSYTY